MDRRPAAQVTRRSVVRTAGHAAWAAPVVVAATAAPAMAVSLGGTAIMTEVQTARSITTLVVDSRYRNLGTATANGLKATVQAIPVAGMVTGVIKIDDDNQSSPGWVQDAPATITNGMLTATFTYANTVPANSMAVLVIDLSVTTVGDPNGMNGGTSSGAIQSTPTVTAPGTAAAGSGSWT